MKKVLKKNQIIITALAIMIAVAGYINYSDSHLGMDELLNRSTAETDSADAGTDKEETQVSSNMDTIVEDIDSLDYDITDETALAEENAATTDASATAEAAETPGEAILTDSSTFAAQAKISREQIRSTNKETLLEVINNSNLTEDQKQEAVSSMVQMTDLAEQEAAAELLLEAKGFENVVVNLTGETADVIVPVSDLGDDQRAQIEDIVKRKTGIAAENIVISPLNEQAE
ncbi:MAG: SpoIIIAH-like family protein [Lachnospiraceae bacterium]